MVNKKNNLWIVIICTMLLGGCSGSPLVRYPSFPEKKNQLKSVSLLEEFLMLDAMATDTSLVNLPENKKLARTCLDYFASTMQEKGYVLNNSLLTSVGIIAEKERKYKIIATPSDEELPDYEIPEGFPPFFVSDTFKKDTLHEQLIQTVYRRIVGYEKGKKDTSGYVRSSTFLGKLFGTECFAFLFVGGYNVHASQQSELVINPKSDSYEKVAYERITQLTMRFYLVDSRTGEIIWDDHVSMNGGIIYKEKLIKMARKILERLPKN
jgi:hypothetical protein